MSALKSPVPTYIGIDSEAPVELNSLAESTQKRYALLEGMRRLVPG